MSRPRSFILAILLLSFVVVAALLLVPTPEAFLRAGLLASSDWLLVDYVSSPTLANRVVGASRKLIATYLQYGLVGILHSKQRVSESDVETVVESLRTVRRVVLNQDQVFHVARGWPVLISGIGYCDQENGIAAQLLAKDFSRAEVFPLLDREKGVSPHAIGRVWSEEFKDWLYFDVHFDEIIVYRRINGTPEFLAWISEPGRQPFRGAASRELYRLDGFVMNELRGNFGSYLAYKARQAVIRRDSSSAVPPVTIAPPLIRTADGMKPIDPAKLHDRENQQVLRSVARLYVTARMEHILGDEVAAAAAYERAANYPASDRDWRAADLSAAARVFAQSLRKLSSTADVRITR